MPGLWIEGESVRHAVAAAVLCVLAVSDVAFAQAPAGPVSDVGRFTVSAEALMLWFKSSPSTPLVSTGTLDDPSTRIVLGGEDLDTNPNPGFRITAGYGLTDRWGVEGSFFHVPPRTTSRTVSSTGRPGSTDLFIPFFDVTPPLARTSRRCRRPTTTSRAAPRSGCATACSGRSSTPSCGCP